MIIERKRVYIQWGFYRRDRKKRKHYPFLFFVFLNP